MPSFVFVSQLVPFLFLAIFPLSQVPSHLTTGSSILSYGSQDPTRLPPLVVASLQVFLASFLGVLDDPRDNLFSQPVLLLSVMPACHSHLVCLVDLLHPRTLDHGRSIIIATSSPRVSPHFLISLLCHFLAIPPLRRTASSLCARSQPWKTQPSHPTRSPFRA